MAALAQVAIYHNGFGGKSAFYNGLDVCRLPGKDEAYRMVRCEKPPVGRGLIRFDNPLADTWATAAVVAYESFEAFELVTRKEHSAEYIQKARRLCQHHQLV